MFNHFLNKSIQKFLLAINLRDNFSINDISSIYEGRIRIIDTWGDKFGPL